MPTHVEEATGATPEAEVKELHILVVDDDIVLCELVRKAFELEGITVAEAHHVIEASGEPDLSDGDTRTSASRDCPRGTRENDRKGLCGGKNIYATHRYTSRLAGFSRKRFISFRKRAPTTPSMIR